MDVRAVGQNLSSRWPNRLSEARSFRSFPWNVLTRHNGRNTQPRSKTGNYMGGQALAEPNPPSIKGIRKGGLDPDLTQHYRGSCRHYRGSSLTPSGDPHEAAWVSPLQIYRVNIYSNINITVIDTRPCLGATDLEEFVIERQFPRIPATITVRM